jgi:IS5 family transposase
MRDVWHLALRQAEGLLRALSSALSFDVPDYTTLWHRLVRDETEEVALPRHDGVTLAIDSTGLAVSQRGEWLRDRWHVHRGFIKAHVAVDVDTLEVLGAIVTDDRGYDAHFLVPLVQRALDRGARVVRVLADAAYDARYNFDFLYRNGIDAGINLRKNADQKVKGGTFARPMAARELHRIGHEEWARKHSYALRWKVECAFSAIKRTMGEALRSTRSDLMLREAQRKFIAYNKLVRA